MKCIKIELIKQIDTPAKTGTAPIDSHLDIKTWLVPADHADTPALIQRLKKINEQYEKRCDEWLREHNDQEEVDWNDPAWVGTTNATIEECDAESWWVEPNEVKID